MKEIVSELKKFLKLEWWIFIIFFICLVFIFATKTWNIWEILIVFFFHCLADVFMMTMWKCYSSWDLRKWWIFQLFANLIFFLIAMYSWIFNWKWNYILAQIWFSFATIKNYIFDVKWKKLKFLDWKLLLIIMTFVSFFYYYFWFITSFWVFVQFLGFIISPLALTINNEKNKYFWFLIWTFIMTIWSAIILFESYLKWHIVWVDISYFLLPLTVCISYFKNLKKYLI